MDEEILPPFLTPAGNPPEMLRQVLAGLMANPRFRALADTLFAGSPTTQRLPVQFGDRNSLPLHLKMGKNVGAATGFSSLPDSTVASAGVVVDMDAIRKAANGDDGKMRAFLRDALIHEFAHMEPVARERHLRAMLGDPKPGEQAGSHPVIQGENRLRGLLDLPPKDFYGLLRR